MANMIAGDTCSEVVCDAIELHMKLMSMLRGKRRYISEKCA